MGDAVDPADLARLKARATWSEDVAADDERARRRAECAAAPTGHVAVEMESGEVPRCTHCGETLSPDALRRAGIRGRRG